MLKSQLFVERFVESKRLTFLDYIANGCELNFMIAIDFTGTHTLSYTVPLDGCWISLYELLCLN